MKTILKWAAVIAAAFIIGGLIYGYLTEKKAHADVDADFIELTRSSARNAAAYDARLAEAERKLSDSNSQVSSLEGELGSSLERERKYRTTIAARDAEVRRVTAERDGAVGELDRLLREGIAAYPDLKEALDGIRDFYSRFAPTDKG